MSVGVVVAGMARPAALLAWSVGTVVLIAAGGRRTVPLLLVAAGQDQIVSTPAIGAFAVRLRAGAHLVIPGARHELLMEQDRYREQFWAAFDAFVPGTPMF